MTLRAFIKERSYLNWYSKNIDQASESSIIESVLDYGTFDDFKKLIKILGIKKVSEIFFSQIRRKRNNYRPEIKNYFSLYFKKNA